MKAIANFLSGAILFFVGIWMLLSNIRVTDIRFLYLSGVNTAPILIVLFVVLIVLAIVNSNKWLWGLVVLDVITMIVSVILGTRFSFARMSVLDLLLMLGTLAVVIGLMIRGWIQAGKMLK